MSAIKVFRANKEYRSKNDANKVLQNFSMNVEQGTIYSIMGPSGCGKTTLISSIIGINTLDSGDITIFGEPTKKNQSCIGYMPQENALIQEFSIREMVWFFGTIFGMTSKKISTRYKFLSDLLELPEGRKIIRECSGGQQRRVSFALTLVHEPELLILDEPTVGLDPLLRVKIWDYLLEITSKNQATVLLSTHYIEEAKQSTHIGLMRNGVLVAEDLPQRILQMTESTSLEEAFLRLSEKQENNSLENNANNQSQVIRNLSTTHTAVENLLVPRRKNAQAPEQSCIKILFALLVKNFLQIYRNIDVLFIALVMPVIGCFCLHNSIGGKIKQMTLGIVNDEVTSYRDCLNSSIFESPVKSENCQPRYLSCKIANAFAADEVSKKFYLNVSEAYNDAKKGETIGYLVFPANFSQFLPLFLDTQVFDANDNGIVKVHLDQTNHQISLHMRNIIYVAYQKVIEQELIDCGLSAKIGAVPMLFNVDGEFGEMSFDFRKTIVPGFMIAGFFAIASYLLSVSINYDKSEGTWNRSLVAGAKPVHFLIAHMIEGSVIMFLQCAVYVAYGIFFLESSLSLQSSFLLSLILVFTGFAGVSWGLLCSVLMTNTIGAIFLGQMLIFPVIFLSGILWPWEAIPVYLQYVGYVSPFAKPAMALRNILSKNTGFDDSSIHVALIVLIAWILVTNCLCVWLIRDKNQPRNKQLP